MITFAIYSFLGFILESIYISCFKKQIYFSGLLKGPFIPLYGFGALLIISIIPSHTNNYEIFFYSLICGTILEYLTHFFLRIDSNIEIWNYQRMHYQYKNRICLFYSITWGILGILLINYINPYINSLLIKLNYNLVNIISFGYFMIIIYQFYNQQSQNKVA